MARVVIKFEGEQGSGKSLLSNGIRDYLAGLGFKVRGTEDTLHVETTNSLKRKIAKRLPNHV